MKKENKKKNYTVEKVYLNNITIKELVQKIVKSHMWVN